MKKTTGQVELVFSELSPYCGCMGNTTQQREATNMIISYYCDKCDIGVQNARDHLCPECGEEMEITAAHGEGMIKQRWIPKSDTLIEIGINRFGVIEVNAYDEPEGVEMERRTKTFTDLKAALREYREVESYDKICDDPEWIVTG
jgi:hypothetical protein